jgi:hypothetical protein
MIDSINEYTKTMREIYGYFSKINVNQYLDKKGQLLYLQWAIAVRFVKEFDPGFTYYFKVVSGRSIQRYSADGEGCNITAEVLCVINCCGHEFEMWLPVMDFRNKAVVNPSSRDISDAKQRCLVKCISVHLGLGSYVYEGLKEPRWLSEGLEVGTHSNSNDDALFTPKNTTPIESVSHNFNPNVTVSVDAVSPNDEGNGSVVDSVVLIGYGAMEMTYGEVYQKNIKSVDSQIAWCKANGKGKKAEEHLANLIQYRMFISSADHAGSTIG